MGSPRVVAGLTVLAAALGCNFAPSGGASGGGDDPGDLDASGSGSAIDSNPGDIGGDHADAAIAAFDACAPSAGLVACYRFESNLEDGSAQNNDLGGAGYGFAAGSAGSALSLDDASQMAAIDDASLDFAAALTIEAWIDPAEAQQRWFVDHDNRWGLELNDDGSLRCTLRVDLDEETDGIEVTGGDAAGGAWTHVACTYDGDKLVLWVAGADVASTDASGPIHTGDGSGFTVGRDAPDGDSFVGLIDTVRIWSLARSQAQIECSAAGDC